jgi:ferrous iron transport protein B
MTCHSGSQPANIAQAARQVVLVGMPNTGKSTLFNRLTGAAASVGNWPGMTVDLMQAVVPLGNQAVKFVDLPGTYNLAGLSDDEKVVQRFLETEPVDLVIAVLNAAQLDRQLPIALQLRALALPMVVVLNLADEAHRFGIQIDRQGLAAGLGCPVYLVSAKHGQGVRPLLAGVAAALEPPIPPRQPLGSILPRLGACQLAVETVTTDLLANTVTMPSAMARTVTQRLDRVLLHPVLGIPLFFLGMFLAFWLVWSVGLPSQDVMAWLTDGLQRAVLEPLIQPLPAVVQDLAINGVWNGLATVASFVPLIVLFFVLMAVLEDSGYLSRAAYLMDALMARMGLDGRSFVLQMMGFGCNVPALMGTRIMRSHPLRRLTMLIVPFSLCSARLQVFVFIIAAVFVGPHGALVLFSLYLLSFATAIGTAALFQGVFHSDEPFVIELPPYRWPTPSHVVQRGWMEVRDFLIRASGFIVLGCVAVWFVTNLPPGATGLDTIGGRIGVALSPIMAPLGIDPYLTLALIFGLIAKEVVIGSLAVIYSLSADAIGPHLSTQLTFAQGYSFCLFCLLYTPCLSTFATLLSESKSWKFSLFSLGYGLVLAWVVSFVFYQSSQIIGAGW